MKKHKIIKKNKKQLSHKEMSKIANTICFALAILSSIAIGGYLIFINEPLGDALTLPGIKLMSIFPPMLLYLVLEKIAKCIVIVIEKSRNSDG